MMMRGRTRVRALWAFRMKYRSIASVTSKSAMTPSLMGRIATMFPACGDHPLRLDPDGEHLLGPPGVPVDRHREGSEQMIPSPSRTQRRRGAEIDRRSCENSRAAG